MSESPLSEDEIDQLLDAIAAGDEEAEALKPKSPLTSSARKIKPFDFRRPNKFLPSRLRELSNVFEDFIRKFQQFLKSEYDIPIVVIGGAPLKVNWEMYSNSKDELLKMGLKSLFVITTDFDETKEIDHDDKNVICFDLKNYNNISKLFIEINTRLNEN